jgi:hypothetical protein
VTRLAQWVLVAAGLAQHRGTLLVLQQDMQGSRVACQSVFDLQVSCWGGGTYGVRHTCWWHGTVLWWQRGGVGLGWKALSLADLARRRIVSMVFGAAYWYIRTETCGAVRCGVACDVAPTQRRSSWRCGCNGARYHGDGGVMMWWLNGAAHRGDVVVGQGVS